MNLRMLMQAGPTRANELFARLAETSDGAIKTRERIFSELKAELELHTSLEEQHLFPVLRRNAETKELAAEAIKDNKELRAKLSELDALPKNDEAFLDRLKALQKIFRQHARDEKRELLPAVQRALSEEQVQSVAQKIEAGVVEAGQIRQDELEERRAKARREREHAERKAQQRADAEHARSAAAEQAQRAEAEREPTRVEAPTAEPQAVAEQLPAAAERIAGKAADAAAATAMAAEASIPRIARNSAGVAENAGTGQRNATGAYLDVIRNTVPPAAISLPAGVADVVTGIGSAWMGWMGKTSLAGVQMSQHLLSQAAERQRRIAVATMQGWMQQNARMMRLSMQMAATGAWFATDPPRDASRARGSAR